ncbi:MAG TPA: amino acid adenylation domain-containing protein, partial [Herpetosiphonaceae bacterium]
MDQTPQAGFRLSPQQRHVWLWQQSSQQPFYAQCTIRIQGALDRATLTAAIRMMVERHEILRTTFHTLPGMQFPLQVIAETLPPTIQDIDLRGLTASDQAARIESLLQSLRGQPLDLTAGSLLQAALIALDRDDQLLVLQAPILIADVAALRLLAQEIGALYTALLQHTPPPDDPPQYVDLASWLNELIESDETASGRDFWRRQDFSGLRTLTLPFAQAGAAQSFVPGAIELSLPGTIAGQIAAFAEQHSVTAEDVLLACWLLLLWRYSSQTDLIVALTSEGRKYEELAQTPGLFAVDLPLHQKIDPQARFDELVRQVQQATQTADEWQEFFAWDYLSDALGDDPAPGSLPFGFACTMLPAPYTTAGLTFTIERQTSAVEPCLVRLACKSRGEALQLTLQYDAQRCTAADVTSMARALETLIANVLDRPAAPLANYALTDASEARRLIALLNPAQPQPATADSFDLRFAAQAQRTPDSIALVDEDQQLTYRELDLRTNQLACHLQALGVGPDTCVALCLDRSLHFIVGLLGVLKAGGAYVPLDPALPAERLQLMLEDIQPRAILTRQSLLANLPASVITTLCLDRDWAMIAETASTPPTSTTDEANLAYVLFTSGSTGRPKGVAVEHRQLSAYLDAILLRLDLPGPAHFALISTTAADLGNTAIFPALTTGGCLHLISPSRAADAAALAEYLARHPIDCLKIVPSHLRALLSGSDPARLLPRQRLILGGEAASWAWVRQLQELMPEGARILNHYGPTETTVGVLTFPVDPAQLPDSATLPIGRPLASAQAHVLDTQLQPVPAWVPGELYIGGATVTRGYLGRPDLTAERFIPDPFSPTPGSRLYRTGDSVRSLPDGTLDFLGRIDHQVKLRGFRIELGEIEAALNQHPQVSACVVVAREEQGGDKQLVAYVTEEPRTKNQEPNGEQKNNGTNEQSTADLPSPVATEAEASRGSGQGPGVRATPEGLRSFLAQRLPEYMVPAAFVILDALPLTANGKIDRSALPAPEPAAAERVVIAPRTPEEELMADLWRQILGVQQISRDDSFFALGGHSLLATQLIARIRATFQVELPLRALFEAPTLVEIVAQVTNLRSSSTPPDAPIQPAPRAGALPLSLAQQGLWFIAQLAPESAAYTMSMPLRLHGPINLDALQQALDALVQRHETLRTTFVMLDGQPLQVIAPHQPIALVLHDLQQLAPDEREAAAARLAAEDAGSPFDLQRGPLLRATVLQLGPTEHVLLLAIHHLIGDGWSWRVLARELATLYLSFSRSQPDSRLPELPIQYADYALWQRGWIQHEAREKMLAYWQQQLAGAPPTLDLPTDYPRPEVATYAGAIHTFLLPLELTATAHDLSHKSSVTPFMVYLATFQILLARYSGQSDILVGTPSANRTRAETEGLIGLFLNTLALRIQLHDNPTFAALLQRVREMTLGAFAHQALPFDQVVEAVQPRRDLRYNPLFQVLFMFQNIPTPVIELPELSVELLEVDSGTSMLDMTFALMETEAGLSGVVEYNTDLFAPTTIERLVWHYTRLLEQLTANPTQPIASVPLLTGAEQEQLAAWNATAAAYPETLCIHSLFEAQAARTPDAVALVDGERSLSYGELNQRANQLAHRLQDLGIGTQNRAETRVGVCLHRSADLIVALLAVLKAGAAYVPLDPAYPADRLAFMLADSEVAILLTQQSLIERLPAHTAHTIYLDADWHTIARLPASNPASAITPEHLAYVIYTSGSTGTPKGVAIQHRSTVALLDWARHVFSAEQLAGVLAATSVCFDLSVFEIFLPLSVGGSVILAENVLQLPSLPAAASVTLINTVPSAMAELVRIGGVPHTVSTVNLAGEPLSRALVQGIYRQTAARHVFNLYGPSEDTTYSTFTEIAPDDERAPSIGRPISNTQAYILDATLQPVPVGVTGELYLSGAGLARGYLQRPALTAERFIPDPFGGAAGSRLYRTGDQARYRPDGTIDFLGRRDHQIKLRGFRIELGEIEAALASHPAVQAAVVMVRHDTPSADQALVAYIVENLEPRTKNLEDSAEPGSRFLVLGSAELRQHLGALLPSYMIPAAFVFLDALPRTPSGKLDRGALPEPTAYGTQLAESGPAFVAPRTPTEELLAGIWERVLGRAPIGVYDQFFELGGHSLLVTQVISRVRETFQVELPLRSVFEAPTIAELARRIETARQSAQGLVIPPLLPAPRSGDLPLSFAQQRLWFLDQLEPNNPFYNIPTAIHLTGRIDAGILEQALNQIVRRHESLRTTFVQETTAADGRAVQVIVPDLALRISIVDLRRLAEPDRRAEIQRLTAVEAQQPFDLQHGPLLRATLLQADPAEHVLLLTLHHIVSDGWSMGILVQELAACYGALTSGDPLTDLLPPLPIQYADYALWQRQWLTPGAAGGVFEQQMSYWKRQLANLPTLDLPSDRLRPPVQSFKGAALRFEVPAALTEELRALSRREGVTLFMTLLAAFKILLARYSGQEDIVVGTPIAGRTRAETENLIGFFVNTLVLRTDLSDSPSVRTLLKRVQERALDAYAHQDLPFELIVDQVQPERDMSRNPLFQILFALQNMPMRTIELPDLTLHSLPTDSATAKFDLWLSLREGPDTLYGTLEYATDLFDAGTIGRLIDQFQLLLAGIVAQPERQALLIPLIPEAEQRRMLVDWNMADTQAPQAPSICLHEMFEAQVARTPDAVALLDGTTKLSYAELNQRANQLAHALRAPGVTPEMPVGLCLDRSADLIVGVMGILKAGGAYLPLDPNYPTERLQLMLADAGATILVTEQALLTRFLALPPHTICLDAEREQLAQHQPGNPVIAVTPDNLAYLIYTSGSTGQPKGVAMSHRALANLMSWQTQHTMLREPARTLQFAPISFDVSCQEIFTTLSSGGTLVLISEEQRHDPAALLVMLRDQQIERLFLPFVALQQLAEAAITLELLPDSLREIMTAGEQLQISPAIAAFFERLPECVLHNQYGPSETHVVTHYTLSGSPATWAALPPIGRPIAGTQIYLLDRRMQPVPLGAVGELYAGGVALARGYNRRPVLTADRFVPDPFSQNPGSRLYRTGDLARYRADGTIEFLGRTDDQVKIRGFRIELGEIEAVLATHPQISECVVVAHADAGGHQRLVAYMVEEPRTKNQEPKDKQRTENKEHSTENLPSPVATEAEASRGSGQGLGGEGLLTDRGEGLAASLRAFLKERLPDYLVPSIFVQLDALPLNTNGKVDRKALPAPVLTTEQEVELVLPRTPVEQTLAEIWAQILQIEQIGVHNNFFALGGDSILSLQMIAQAQQRGLKITP